LLSNSFDIQNFPKDFDKPVHTEETPKEDVESDNSHTNLIFKSLTLLVNSFREITSEGKHWKMQLSTGQNRFRKKVNVVIGGGFNYPVESR
jgi:hypothetical protein